MGITIRATTNNQLVIFEEQADKADARVKKR